MVNPDKLFGRLGNRLFQMAFILKYAKENGTDIYFQDPKWFDNAEVKNLFSDNIPSKTDQVAIHVRRGDYVNNPFYVDLMEKDYYEKAMDMFDGSDFLVFSDDIEWCKQQQMFEGCDFSENLTELDDLNLMASCTGHIIANSSFSWWGAFLSPYSTKIVAPSSKNWYTDGIERTVCPTEWVRI